MFNLNYFFMKRFYLVLLGFLSMFLLIQCSDGPSNGALNAKDCSSTNSFAVKKSVVSRVVRLGSTFSIFGVLLENNDKLIYESFSVNYKNEVEYGAFLRKGDTVVYQRNNIIEVYWKK